MMKSLLLLAPLLLCACTGSWPSGSYAQFGDTADVGVLAPAVSDCLAEIVPYQAAVSLTVADPVLASVLTDELIRDGLTLRTDGRPVRYVVAPFDAGEFIRVSAPSGPYRPWLQPHSCSRSRPPRRRPLRRKSSLARIDEQARARARAWATYYQQRDQLLASRFEMETRARQGGNDPLQTAAGGGSQIPAREEAPPEPPGSTGAPGAVPAYSTGGTDPAAQTGKQAFLRTPGDPYGLNEDLPGAVHGPKPNTIMEGTPIPGRLVDGATSDSPGQLVAEVLSNVYDSMTGNVLLIPQWTRIITTYDTAVSAGQDRIGVISQRLIFPDTGSRQLGSMQIADQSGMAGLKDVVRTHFWEKFWATALISLAGTGAQLAQPQQSAFSGYSPSSVAAGQMTQGFSQLGQAYAQRGLSIPNTIELRPGLELVIKPNRDITLPPYVDHRDVSANASTAHVSLGPLVQ